MLIAITSMSTTGPSDRLFFATNYNTITPTTHTAFTDRLFKFSLLAGRTVGLKCTALRKTAQMTTVVFTKFPYQRRRAGRILETYGAGQPQRVT
jgi:hypothetical protein